jgi:hypothetical protein
LIPGELPECRFLRSQIWKGINISTMKGKDPVVAHERESELCQVSKQIQPMHD